MKTVKFTKIAYWDMRDDNWFYADGELITEVDSEVDLDECGCEIIEDERPWMVNSFAWELIVV